MEPAQIDWDQIDSHFVEDVFYEHIRAPKWFDFLAPVHLDSIDDNAWFCKPDCKHPTKPEDFYLTPTSSKFVKNPSLSDTNEALEIEVIEQNQRRSEYALSPSIPNNQESENQNPNLATTPPSYKAKSWRAEIKSNSVEKMEKETPRLKSTQSARNLFSGRDILGHISEFCYELKRLATRVTEREDTDKSEVKENHQPCNALELELKRERKPLLEVSKEKIHKSIDVKGNTFKENHRRKKREDDAENVPVNVETVKNKGEKGRRKKRIDDDAENKVPIPLNLETLKNKGQDRLLQQIRTNPPSPQCFSNNKTATLKPLRTKPMEVVKKSKKEEEEEKNKKNGEVKEARGLGVLWFLKPCTL